MAKPTATVPRAALIDIRRLRFIVQGLRDSLIRVGDRSGVWRVPPGAPTSARSSRPVSCISSGRELLPWRPPQRWLYLPPTDERPLLLPQGGRLPPEMRHPQRERST